MDIIKELYDMKETVGQKIADANKKLHKAGGAMDMSDIEIVDKLTHAMKSLVTTCAMLEAEEDGGYSGDMMPTYGGNYSGKGRRNGYGGERRNGYSGRMGYSRTGDMREQLRQMMEDAPDEQTRMEIRNLIDRMG